MLLAGVTVDNFHSEVSTGDAVGSEMWSHIETAIAQKGFEL